jgi:hypothetical protein
VSNPGAFAVFASRTSFLWSAPPIIVACEAGSWVRDVPCIATPWNVLLRN